MPLITTLRPYHSQTILWFLCNSTSAKQSNRENSMKKSTKFTMDSSAQSSSRDYRDKDDYSYASYATSTGTSVQPTRWVYYWSPKQVHSFPNTHSDTHSNTHSVAYFPRKNSYKEFAYVSDKMDDLSAAAGILLDSEKRNNESSSFANNSMRSTAHIDNKGPGQGQVSGYVTPTVGSSSHGTTPTPLSSTRGGGGFSHLLVAPALTAFPVPSGAAGIGSGPNLLNPLSKQTNGSSSTAVRDDRHIGQGPTAVRKEEIYEVCIRWHATYFL